MEQCIKQHQKSRDLFGNADVVDSNERENMKCLENKMAQNKNEDYHYCNFLSPDL